jgi:hypothetical protein
MMELQRARRCDWQLNAAKTKRCKNKTRFLTRVYKDYYQYRCWRHKKLRITNSFERLRNAQS